MCPIVGMTRRVDLQAGAAHRLVYGELRKGGPKTDPKKPGPDLDHWRFTSERPEVLAAFYAAYPGEPKVIDAYLPFDSLEKNFITWMEEYDAGGLRHRCDGQTMYRWRGADGNYQDGERPCPYFSGQKERTKDQPGCKQVGRLFLVVPELVKAGHVGLVSMESHSINDLISITASLLDIEAKAGRLNGILCSVMRVQETVSTPAWKEEDRRAGKRNRTTKHLVKIVPAAEWVMARLHSEAHEQMVLAGGKPLEIERRSQNVEDDWGDDDDDLDLPEFADPDLPDEQPEDVEDAEWGKLTPATEERANTPAAQIIARLRDLGRNDARPMDEATSKKLWGHLSSLCRNEARSKELVRMVYEVAHTDKLTLGQANTLIGWIVARPTKDENGKIIEWVPSGPALTAGEYKILFPPEPELLPEE